jgi:serine/threonine protein kinase
MRKKVNIKNILRLNNKMEGLTYRDIQEIIFSLEITDKKLNELIKELTPYKTGNNGTVYKFIGIDGKTYILKESTIDISVEEVQLQNLSSRLDLSPYIYKRQYYGSDLYLVMDYIDGITLEEYIENDNKNILEIVNKVLDKIEILHDNKIFHGDLNFGNIMIDKYDNIFFIDFIYFSGYTSDSIRLSIDYNQFMGSVSYYMKEKYRDIYIEIYKRMLKYNIGREFKEDFGLNDNI